MTPLPTEIDRFSAALREAVPGASVGVDRPTDRKGSWWLDVASDDFRSSIEWRPADGFGVFTSELGYGDRPDEVYRSTELAVKRVVQLLRHWEATSKLLPLSLSDIRQLRETRQTALASTLEVNQAAISRLENRENMQLSSLQAYLRAMGGRLEIRVHFDSFDATVRIAADDDAGTGTAGEGSATSADP